MKIIEKLLNIFKGFSCKSKCCSGGECSCNQLPVPSASAVPE